MKLFSALVTATNGHTSNIRFMIKRKKASRGVVDGWEYTIKTEYAYRFEDKVNNKSTTFFFTGNYHDAINYYFNRDNISGAKLEYLAEIEF